MLLDTTVNTDLDDAENSRTGIYLQVNGYEIDHRDYLLYRGIPSVAKDHGVMPHRKWKLEYNGHIFPDYDYVLGNSSLPLETAYHFTRLFTLPGTSEKASLLALPVCSSDGTAYGVCGFEISESLFKQMYQQSSSLVHMSALVSDSFNNNIFDNFLSCGTSDNYYYSPQGELAVTPFGKGLYEFSNDTDSFVGVIRNNDGDSAGNKFTTAVMIPKNDYQKAAFGNAVRMGLRAQVQHLKAYASTDKLNKETVDPRFNYVTRGCAPKVKDLTGRWATSKTYGDDLTRMINDLLGQSADSAAKTSVKINLSDVPSEVTGKRIAYVDGVATTLDVDGKYGTVQISGSGPHSVTMYEYNSASAAAHDVYPTHMYSWIVSSNGSSYTATRYYGLDDLLRYAGSSIRITGKKGIRMITGMASTAKSTFTGSGVNGYTIVETGTLLAWSDRVTNGSLTFDTPGVSRGKAYVRGSQNPIFSSSNGVEYYTNVLVGFSGADQYKRDMAMRSYAILQDASGNKFTVYGCQEHRVHRAAECGFVR